MPGTQAADRRRSPRHRVSAPVRVSTGPTGAKPSGALIDLSRDGTLVRLDEAEELPGRSDRVVLSIELPDGVLHLLGRAQRNVRGDDGRWYIAVEFDVVEPMDRARLDRLVAPRDPADPTGAAAEPATIHTVTPRPADEGGARPTWFDVAAAAIDLDHLEDREEVGAAEQRLAAPRQRSFSNVTPSSASASILASS